MDKNHFVSFCEYKIRLTRKVSLVESEPVAETMDETAHREFGLHILTANRPHVRRARFAGFVKAR
jgi:hypothetical protein